ncbi:MAG: homoserine dehydrogenase [Planctomycetota bacterium]
MNDHVIGLVGWGTVGGGVLDVLEQDGQLLAERCGMNLVVKTIVDADLERPRSQKPDAQLASDVTAVNDDPAIETVIHLVPGTTIARELVIASLSAGKHVVTANKALLAEHGDELFAIASKHSVSIAFEAAVAGGIPVIAALRDGLAANSIVAIHAILNGTCNYILDQMEVAGLSYDEALERAQALGYAEADPTLDVNGHDTAHKLAILARIAFMGRVDFADISIEGIEDITAEDIASAQRMGCRIKLLAVARKQRNGIELRVAPTLVATSLPLAGVTENYNAVRIDASNAGPTLLVGQGAGASPTASAVLADVVDIATGRYQGTANRFRFFQSVGHLDVLPEAQEETASYARFTVPDRVGLLAALCQRLSEAGISLLSVNQSRPDEHGQCSLEVTTHPCRGGDFLAAVARIEADGLTADETRMFRMLGDV